MKIFLRIMSLILIIVSGYGFAIYIGHSDILLTTTYEFNSDEVPDSFVGKKIVQLSDLHNHAFSYDNTSLLDEVNVIHPDYIFLTGDFVDQYSKEKELDAISVMLDSFSYSQMFFVPGNHEEYSPMKTNLYTLLNAKGVNILDDVVYTLYNDTHTEYVNLVGIHDPYRDHKDNYLFRNEGKIDETLKTLTKDMKDEDFNILLAHRPELIDIYAKYKFDMVFSGHTHGGQLWFHTLTVPFIVNQGFFPHYTRGRYFYYYEGKEVVMYLSAGLGTTNSFNLRYNCNPEIVQVSLV